MGSAQETEDVFKPLKVSLRPLKPLGICWFHLQPTFLFPGWGTSSSSWKFGCMSQGNRRAPSYSLFTGALPHDSLKWLLLVAACGKSNKGARQLIEMGEAQAACSGFEQRILMRKKMINIGVYGFSFHSLVLYTQGTFSFWYKVLTQVGETNIWQPHLAKIKYTEIHFTYRCSVFKLNNNTLFWPNLFVLVGLGSETNPSVAKDPDPNQAGPQTCLNSRLCLLLQIPSLYLLSLNFSCFSSYLQSRLIPLSLSGYICVRARANLETQEGPVDFSSCAYGLQQPKCSILIATPTVLVCAWPFWGPHKELLEHAGRGRVCANLSTGLHHIRTEHDWSDLGKVPYKAENSCWALHRGSKVSQ